MWPEAVLWCAVCRLTCCFFVLKDYVIVLLQKKSKGGLADEADSLRRCVTETEAQLELVKEQLESLRTSTASTIQSLGRNNIVSALPTSLSQSYRPSFVPAHRTAAL